MRYVIYDNDTEQGVRAHAKDIESVFAFFKGQYPELFSVGEFDGDDLTQTLNGQTWLEENACPCCGETRMPPFTNEEIEALRQADKPRRPQTPESKAACARFSQGLAERVAALKRINP